MAESQVKIRADINTVDLEKADKITGDIASNWSRYVDHVGQGRKDAEALTHVLTKHHQTHADIAKAMREQVEAQKQLLAIREKWQRNREDVWGDLVNAGVAPPGGHPAVERRLTTAEHQVDRNIDRLNRLSHHMAERETHERRHQMLQVAEVGAAILGAHSALGFYRETIAASKGVYPTLRQATLSAGGRGANLEGPFRAFDASLPFSMRGIASKLTGGLITPPEQRPTLTPDQEEVFGRFLSVGMGGAEIARMMAHEARVTGQVPHYAQVGRLAQFGQLVAGNPEEGGAMFERLFQQFFATDAQANAVMLGVTRAWERNKGRVGYNELYRQQQSLLGYVSGVMPSSDMTGEGLAGVLGLQGVLQGMGSYGRGPRGVEALMQVLNPTRPTPLAELAQIQAYQSAYGRSPFQSVASMAEFTDLTRKGLQFASPKMLDALLQQFHQQVQQLGPEFVSWQVHPGLTVEQVKRIDEATSGEQFKQRFEEAMGTMQSSEHGEGGEGAGAQLDRFMGVIYEAAKTMLGTEIILSEALGQLGIASSTLAAEINAYAERIKGGAPEAVGYGVPTVISTAAGTGLGLTIARGIGGAVKWAGRKVLDVLGHAPGAALSHGTDAAMSVGRGLGSWVPGAAAILTMPFTESGVGGSPARDRSRLRVSDDARKAALREHLRAEAIKRGLDPDIMDALAETESGYNINAKSLTGVRGVMQMTKGAVRELGGTEEDYRRISDPNNQAEHIRWGLDYFKLMMDRNQGDYADALAAYHGPQADPKTGITGVDHARIVLAKARRIRESRPVWERAATPDADITQRRPIEGPPAPASEGVRAEDLKNAIRDGLMSAHENNAPREIPMEPGGLTVSLTPDASELFAPLYYPPGTMPAREPIGYLPRAGH